MNFTTLEISLLASLNPTTQVGKYILLLLLLGVVYMYVGSCCSTKVPKEIQTHKMRSKSVKSQGQRNLKLTFSSQDI